MDISGLVVSIGDPVQALTAALVATSNGLALFMEIGSPSPDLARTRFDPEGPWIVPITGVDETAWSGYLGARVDVRGRWLGGAVAVDDMRRLSTTCCWPGWRARSARKRR